MLSFLAAASLVLLGGSPAKKAPSPSSSQKVAAEQKQPAAFELLDPLPVETLEGQTSKLGAHRKPVTVLALWATYCVPCIEEMPELDALRRSFANDADVAVLSLNTDGRAKVPRAKELVARKKFETPVFRVDSVEELKSGIRLALETHHPPDFASSRIESGLPMLVFLNARGEAHVEVGYRVTTEARFIAHKRALIDAVRRSDWSAVERAGDVLNAPLSDEEKAAIRQKHESLRTFMRQKG